MSCEQFASFCFQIKWICLQRTKGKQLNRKRFFCFYRNRRQTDSGITVIDSGCQRTFMTQDFVKGNHCQHSLWMEWNMCSRIPSEICDWNVPFSRLFVGMRIDRQGFLCALMGMFVWLSKAFRMKWFLFLMKYRGEI